MVVARTSEVVVIAADSLQLDNEGNTVTPAKVCKITLLGRKSAFASAGLSVHPGLNFSAEDLAVEAWNKEQTFKSREQAFTDAVIPRLTHILQLMKDQAPDKFAQFRKIALETFFITIENNVPKVVETNYLTHVKQDGTVSITAKKGFCPGDCPRPDLMYVNYIGQNTIIEKSRKTGMQFPSPADTAYGLVQSEIANAKGRVGPPISTLQITKDERRWLTSGECETPQERGKHK